MDDVTGRDVKDDRRRSAADSPQSMRAFIATLEAAGQVASIGEPISADFEIAACLAEADAGPALRFEQIGGHQMPVVGNLLNSLPRFAMGLRTTQAELQGAIIAAIEAPLAHRVLTSAPCQEKIIVDPVLVDELPIPRFFEHERGPYITAGAIVAKDRRTRSDQSFDRAADAARRQPRVCRHCAEPSSGRAGAASACARRDARYRRLHRQSSRRCWSPPVFISDLGDDELKVAGALLGEPLDVVRCVSSDLLVPAHCECVLEGTLDAGEPLRKARSASFTACTRTTAPASSRRSAG